jgi:hypothetical protein
LRGDSADEYPSDPSHALRWQEMIGHRVRCPLPFVREKKCDLPMRLTVVVAWSLMTHCCPCYCIMQGISRLPIHCKKIRSGYDHSHVDGLIKYYKYHGVSVCLVA